MIACVDAKHAAGTDVSLCVDVDAFAETAATAYTDTRPTNTRAIEFS